MLNDLSSPLALLETRRSARPRDLIEPGPDAAQLRAILTIAARTPDHGKLHPWRFVHVPADARGAFAAMLDRNGKKDVIRDELSSLLKQNVGVAIEVEEAPESAPPPARPVASVPRPVMRSAPQPIAQSAPIS